MHPSSFNLGAGTFFFGFVISDKLQWRGSGSRCLLGIGVSQGEGRESYTRVLVGCRTGENFSKRILSGVVCADFRLLLGSHVVVCRVGEVSLQTIRTGLCATLNSNFDALQLGVGEGGGEGRWDERSLNTLSLISCLYRTCAVPGAFSVFRDSEEETGVTSSAME